LYGNYGVNLSFARSLRDGRELWEYEAGRVVEGSATSFSGAIIEASDNLALVQMAMRKNDVETDTLVALDAQTGKVRWQSAPGFDGAALFASPSAAETTIYGPHKSTLVALRSGNGTQLWQADFSHYAGLKNMIVAGGVLFALFEPSCRYSPCLGETTVPRLMALDGATGATYWERDLPDAIYLAPTL
jgi:outer membrane protein assembly factor BamB